MIIYYDLLIDSFYLEVNVMDALVYIFFVLGMILPLGWFLVKNSR